MNANDFREPSQAGYWGNRPCLREPIEDIFVSAEELSRAADAFLSGDLEGCEKFVAAADKPAIREWIESLWGSKADNPEQPHYHRQRAVPDQPLGLSKEDRHAIRMPSRVEQGEILRRWGWHCAYCGIPLIHTQARNVLRRALGPGLRWGPRNKDKHAAFQCMTLEFDHVVPHSVGGTSECDNTVPSCGPCNCGKFTRTLAEHGLDDPRDRHPKMSDWDGLTRLLQMPPEIEKAKLTRYHDMIS